MNNVFLAGEKIDLCVPEDADFGKWASWFNSQKITQFLEQGKFPNTVSAQRKFFEQVTHEGRFLCLIKTKDGDLLGVISLSEISYEKRSCQVAYVCPERSEKAPLAALEALAICVQHAFNRFGMERVWAGHFYPGLRGWAQKTELLGFMVDGIVPNGIRHGEVVSDAINTSILRERFLKLVQTRNGSLWPGEDSARKMIRKLKEKPSLADRVYESITDMHRSHEEYITQVELQASKIS